MISYQNIFKSVKKKNSENCFTATIFTGNFTIYFRSFCESYDMKPHSTKIFRDIVNGLGSYIQSQFMSTSTSQSSQSGRYSVTVLLQYIYNMT